MVEHHFWFWWWPHLLNNSIEKQNQLKNHGIFPDFTHLFWSRKYENFQFHSKQKNLSNILSLKYSDFNFYWNRVSRTWFARAIRRSGFWSKMSPGMSCSNGGDHIRMFFFYYTKNPYSGIWDQDPISENRKKIQQQNATFFFEIIFRPEKIMFFRWDFFLSSSPDSGESFGSDFRTIPAV